MKLTTFAFLTLATPGWLAAQLGIFSEFASSADGWSCSNTTSLRHVAMGGVANGGFLEVDNSEGLGPSVCVAPQKFLGNLAPYYGGSFSFQGNMLRNQGPPWGDDAARPYGGNYGTVRITGAGRTVSKDLEPGLPPQRSWKKYELSLTGATFGVSEESFRELLSSVTRIDINLEAIFGEELQGLDEVIVFNISATQPKLSAKPDRIRFQLKPGYYPENTFTLIHVNSPVADTPVTATADGTIPSSGSIFAVLNFKEQKFTTPHPVEFSLQPDLPPGVHRARIVLSSGRPDVLGTEVEVEVHVEGTPAIPDTKGLPTELFPERRRFFDSDRPHNPLNLGPLQLKSFDKIVPLLKHRYSIEQAPTPPIIDADPFGDILLRGCMPSWGRPERFAPQEDGCTDWRIPYVAFGLSPARGRFNVLDTHLPYRFTQGATMDVIDSVALENTTNAPVPWTVRVVQTVPIVTVDQSGGILAPGRRDRLTVRVNARGLAFGRYSAMLVFSPSDVVTVDVEVVSATQITVSSYGTQWQLIDTKPAPKELTVTNWGIRPYRFDLRADVAYTPTPKTGTIPPAGSIKISILPNVTPAFDIEQTLHIMRLYNLDLPAEEPKIILNRTLRLGGPLFPRSAERIAPSADACVPAKLYPILVEPSMGFTARTGFPERVRAEVVDNCGNSLDQGQVSVQASNGDAWTPLRATASVVGLEVVAYSADGLLAGSFVLNGQVEAGTDPAPALEMRTIVNAATVEPGRPHAPGEIVSLYGTNLAAGTQSARGFPLPTTLAGTTVLFNGSPIPLLFASPGQINAIVPFGVAPGAVLPLVVQRGNRISAPVEIPVVAANPGVFTANQSGAGAGIFVDANFRLISGSNPARAGQVVIALLTGLGEVEPPVPTGAQTPSATLSRVRFPVEATIAGQRAPVAFAGLAPGFAGLYQINLTVPAGVAPGDAVPVVIRAGTASSPVTTLTLR